MTGNRQDAIVLVAPTRRITSKGRPAPEFYRNRCAGGAKWSLTHSANNSNPITSDNADAISKPSWKVGDKAINKMTIAISAMFEAMRKTSK